MKGLYTRRDADGEPNTEIEEWFSSEIESPFRQTLELILSLPGRTSEPAPKNRKKKELIKKLGFVAGKTVDFIKLSNEDIRSLSRYIAALLVRTPKYLNNLKDYHEGIVPDGTIWGVFNKEDIITQLSLNNMKELFELYCSAIENSDLIFLNEACDKEFLYSDTGIIAEEPWSDHGIPFDIHVPLTPELAVEVFPVPDKAFEGKYPLVYVNAQGLSRMNRIIVGNAEQFVFSRSSPPIAFIKKNFGIPAPKSIGTRIVGGKLEVFYDKSRDR